jgi:hypothetical protein
MKYHIERLEIGHKKNFRQCSHQSQNSRKSEDDKRPDLGFLRAHLIQRTRQPGTARLVYNSPIKIFCSSAAKINYCLFSNLCQFLKPYRAPS